MSDPEPGKWYKVSTETGSFNTVAVHRVHCGIAFCTYADDKPALHKPVLRWLPWNIARYTWTPLDLPYEFPAQEVPECQS